MARSLPTYPHDALEMIGPLIVAWDELPNDVRSDLQEQAEEFVALMDSFAFAVAKDDKG